MITGRQRSYLKSIANTISPVVTVSKEGITEGVYNTIDDYLTANEMIKVSILSGVELDANEVCNDLAEKLNAEFVQAIGRKFVLYRQAPSIANRRIGL